VIAFGEPVRFRGALCRGRRSAAGMETAKKSLSRFRPWPASRYEPGGSNGVRSGRETDNG